MVPPTPFTATLAGVHDHAINVALTDERGEYYVSIVHRRAEWTDLAVRLADTAWETLTERIRRRQGVPVGVFHEVGDRNRTVAAGRSHTSMRRNDLTLFRRRIAAAVAKKSTTDSGPTASGNDGAIRPWGLLALVDRSGSHAAPRDVVFARFKAILARATKERSESLDLSNLVGLGRGATPAGDDFLSGILLYEEMIRPRPAIPLDREAIVRCLGGTNPGGSSLLRVSLAGYPPAYQLDLVAAIATGNVDEVVAIAQSHGASSGFDTLAGLLWRSGLDT